MRVSSDRPTTVLPFSLNSTGIVAACAVLMRSIPFLRPSRDLVGKVFHHRKHRVGAACPSPHMDASIIAWESSFSSGWSHFFFSISLSAFAVPTLQGVHCPQDSSEKNFMRFLAAVVARSRSEKITIAAEPMKQPYWF